MTDMKFSTVDVPEAAAETQDLLVRLAAGYEPPDEPDPAVDLTDVLLPLRGGAVPVRIYRSPGRESRPLVLWLHGGGFVGGSVEDLDHPCSHVARKAQVHVVSLEYRLAPARPFPAALHDTCDAIGWLHRHGGLFGGDGRMAAAGQSAGGNLVAAACLMRRDTGRPTVGFQVLCYPMLDFGHETESRRAFDGVFLSLTGDPPYERDYLAGLPAGPYAAPLRAGTLAGLPPSLVVGAGRDPLRDDARAYARRLHDDKVDVTYVEYAHTMHAILNFCSDLAAGRHLINVIAAHLRDWAKTGPGGDSPR